MRRLLPLERDDFRSNRHPAVISFCLSMSFFTKPVPTFAGHALAIALSALACIRPAVAQEWPTRAVTMVVPFAAGGPADTVGRILSPRLADFLGQQAISLARCSTLRSASISPMFPIGARRPRCRT